MAEVARKGVDDFKIRCENIVAGEVVKDLKSACRVKLRSW